MQHKSEAKSSFIGTKTLLRLKFWGKENEERERKKT